MQYYASIDFGFDTIKIIYGTKKNKFVTAEVFLLNIPEEAHPKKEISEQNFDSYYDKNHNIYFDLLEEMLNTFNKNTEYSVSFNSLFANIFVKNMNAYKKKQLDISGSFLSEKLKSEKRINNYNILGFNKETCSGSILIYSLLEKAFKDFKELLSNLLIKNAIVEFDSLSYANCISEFCLSKESIFIDIGFSKTNIVTFSNYKLENILHLNIGINQLLKSISNRTGYNIKKTAEILYTNNLDMIKSFGLNLEEIYEPFIKNFNYLLIDKINTLPSKIHLTGGSLSFPLFKEKMSSIMNIKIDSFTPITKYSDIDVKTFEPGLFTIALGLFLRHL